LDIDYAIYGAGEARLAWLDDEAEIISPENRAIEAATALVNTIYAKIQEQGYPIGHLKFLMTAGSWQRKISFTAMNEPKLKRTHSLMGQGNITLMINARVQTEPAALVSILQDAIGEVSQHMDCSIISRNRSAFQPGFPKPAHRIS
jgi:hypothetical protein